MAPLLVLVTSRAGFLLEQQPQPGPCEALYWSRVLGALALRSLVAWALRLSDGMQKNAGAVRITRGDSRFALRTVLRRVAFGHRPHVGERAAIVAEIFIDRHFRFPRAIGLMLRDGGCGAANTQPSRIPSRRDYLSCDSGIWMSPLMCLIGPADDGMMSKSKISVGSHSVAQAFGTSTTPEMWPWHGAVPRIE